MSARASRDQDKDSTNKKGGDADSQGDAVKASNEQSGDAALKRIAGGGGAIEDLGELDKPGAELAGKVKTLKPGDSLRFAAPENQIYGVQQVQATGPVTVEQKLLKAMNKGELGNQNVYQYTLTMKETAKAGEKSEVSALAGYQSRNDKDYQFNFTIKCD